MIDFFNYSILIYWNGIGPFLRIKFLLNFVTLFTSNVMYNILIMY